jgi:signal peptidase I
MHDRMARLATSWSDCTPDLRRMAKWVARAGGSSGSARGYEPSICTGMSLGWRSVAAIAMICVSAGALFVAVHNSNWYAVASASMEPTLQCAGTAGCQRFHADRVLVSGLLYKMRGVHRGDIIAFMPAHGRSNCGAGRINLKRVIALPHEIVDQRHGVVFVNDKPLREPYLRPDSRYSQNFGPVSVPSGHLFVMGDNRRVSCDSRDFGPISHTKVRGAVIAVYWPLARARLFQP